MERSNEDQLIKWLKKDFENIVSHKDYKSKLNTSEDEVELHATNEEQRHYLNFQLDRKLFISNDNSLCF